MKYADVVRDLGLEQVCPGGCGLDDYRHRGTIFLGVIHWRERRFTRRGLRRLLLLVARRERESATSGFLNHPNLRWCALWWDEQRANGLASELGIRFPAAWSRQERLACLASARGWPISRTHPAIYAWANR